MTEPLREQIERIANWHDKTNMQWVDPKTVVRQLREALAAASTTSRDVVMEEQVVNGERKFVDVAASHVAVTTLREASALLNKIADEREAASGLPAEDHVLLLDQSLQRLREWMSRMKEALELPPGKEKDELLTALRARADELLRE